MKSQLKNLPHSLTPSLSFECVKAKLSLKPSPTGTNSGSQDLIISSATNYNNVVNVAPSYNVSLAAIPAHHNNSPVTPGADQNKSLVIQSELNTSEATPPGYSRSPATALEHNIPVATPQDYNIFLATDQCGQHFTKTEEKFLVKGEGDWTIIASPVAMKSSLVSTPCQGSLKKFVQNNIANDTAHGENEGPSIDAGDETCVEMTLSKALVDLVNLHMAILNSSSGAFLEIGEMNKDMEVVVKISGTKNQVRQTYRHVQQLVEGEGSSSSDA